jgi:hypothetical protein
MYWAANLYGVSMTKDELVKIIRSSPPDVAAQAIIELNDTATAVEEIETLQDRFRNGIRYDEENNQYILVWTQKELDEAKKEADELAEFFNATDSSNL